MMQRVLILLFMVVAIFSFASAGAQTMIVGQNNPTVDIQAIQGAVDQGGIINLRGTFDFGNEGRVNITRDVKIVGEGNGGKPVTKIKGGFWTFHSPLCRPNYRRRLQAPGLQSKASILMELYGLPFIWLTAVVRRYPITK